MTVDAAPKPYPTGCDLCGAATTTPAVVGHALIGLNPRGLFARVPDIVATNPHEEPSVRFLVCEDCRRKLQGILNVALTVNFPEPARNRSRKT